MKTIVLYLAKKYIINSINYVLEKNKDSVSNITSTLDVWIARLETILTAMKKLNNRVADGRLDDEEIKDSVAEIETLIKEFAV